MEIDTDRNRRQRLALVALFAVAIAAPAAAKTPPTKAPPLSVVVPIQDCAGLSAVDVTDIGGTGSKIDKAAETTKDGIAVCAVEGTLAPAIKFKVSLPLKTWSQRYLQVGCGGLCGNIPEQVGAADNCVPLNAGSFVVAGTDMGHQGGGGSFGRDHQKLVDFAYRGVHLTALASKKLIKAFYGRAEAYSYFAGCSDGGREALMEAQRYPKDFNGILAGAAAMNFEVQNSFYHAWQAQSNTGADGKPILIAARLSLLHKAVLAQCDKLDGLEDGLISEPRACRFDPKILLCLQNPAQPGTDCLSAAEVEAARKLYDGPADPYSGLHLTAGGPLPGSELNWAGVFVPFSADGKIFSASIALDAIRNVIFATNPPDDFTLADFKFSERTFDRLQAHHPLLDATNTDLTAFAAKGGKLILYHGWGDPHISPYNTIAYHDVVGRVMGEKKRQSFERLYLFPGMSHCSGGDGPNQFDLLTPMLSWVEKHRAPDAIIAKQAPHKANSFGQPPQSGDAPKGPQADAMKPPAQQESSIVRTRPVYPYPYMAKYKGKGDPNDAKNFVRVKSAYAKPTPAWAGDGFYHPYKPAE